MFFKGLMKMSCDVRQNSAQTECILHNSIER